MRPYQYHEERQRLNCTAYTKANSGKGKTVVLSHKIEDIVKDPRLQAVSVAFVFFTNLTAILGSYISYLGAPVQVQDIFDKRVETVAGIGAVLSSLFLAWLVLYPKTREAGRLLDSREAYLTEIIEQVQRSKESIWLCVHTLRPAEPGSDVERLQNALSDKKSLPGGMTLIAPIGEDRVQASAQINKLGIPIRHVAALEDKDLTFSVFDSNTCVLHSSAGEVKKTQAIVTVANDIVANLIERHMAGLLSQINVMRHDDFIRFTVRNIIDNNQSIGLSAIARRLNVEEEYLRFRVPAFGAGPQCRVFIIIGRPCSGKTTVAGQLRSILYDDGITYDKIYDFNDYEALYYRFSRDKFGLFEATKLGGFGVRDFSVLDTVLREADFLIHNAEPFFSACIVEFARDKYIQALQNFRVSLINRSTVIHVKCKLDTCRARNNQRNGLSDDHRTGRVPDDILNKYYANEAPEDLTIVGVERVIEIDTDEVPLNSMLETLRARLHS
jgi:hypothetical protein